MRYERKESDGHSEIVRCAWSDVLWWQLAEWRRAKKGLSAATHFHLTHNFAHGKLSNHTLNKPRIALLIILSKL